MRKVTSATLTHESWEEMTKAGRYNRALQLTCKTGNMTHMMTISGGESDRVDVYREGKRIFVLTQNQSLGYLGLEVFKEGELVGDVFFEGDAAAEVIGRGNPSPVILIKKLSEYV